MKGHTTNLFIQRGLLLLATGFVFFRGFQSRGDAHSWRSAAPGGNASPDLATRGLL